MALIKCSECGHEVSDKATSCPNCGCPIADTIELTPKKSKKKWVISSVIAVAFIAICVGCWFAFDKVFPNDDPDAIVELTPEFIERVQQYDALRPFSEGRAAVCKNSKWGYIDIKGKEVVECQYDRAEEYHEGVTQVVKDEKTYYINKKGEILFEGEGGRFSHGLALLDDGRVVNPKGEEVFKVNLNSMAYSMSREPNQSSYTMYPYFIDEAIRIWGDDEEKCYDINGKEIPMRDQPEPSAQYMPFTVDIDPTTEFDSGNRTGLKDSNGNIVIAPKYSDVSDVSNGVALITLRENDAYYYGLNEEGTELKANDGMYEEFTPRFYAYADLKGNTTFSQKTLDHITEADMIGNERSAAMIGNRKAKAQENERRRQEGELVTISLTADNDNKGHVANVRGNYPSFITDHPNKVATEKIQVPRGKVWVYEGIDRGDGAMWMTNAIFSRGNIRHDISNYGSDYSPYGEKNLLGNGRVTSPIYKRHAVLEGDYVQIVSDVTYKSGEHNLVVTFREMDLDIYKSKCGF